MAKFHIGDIVIGNDKNRYGITNQETLLKVTEVNEKNFSGEIIGTKTSSVKKHIGEVKTELEPSMFDLATTEVINTINGLKKSGEKATKIKLNGGLEINVYEKGYESNFNTDRVMQVESDANRVAELKKIIDKYDEKTKNNIWQFKEDADLSVFDIFKDEAKFEQTNKLMNFFKEFEYIPSFRFFDTLLRLIQTGNKEAKDYIVNYFKLQDHPYAASIAEKIKSPEFDGILKGLSLYVPAGKPINRRLKVYFGAPGAGKSYQALKESDNNCIVCNSGMLPNDLIDDFNFKDGKPGFQKSALRKAMEEGTTLVLDEMNLLNMDSARFLQGLLDGKSSIIWKDETIKIKEGFNIIGTMNLHVNSTTFSLPEPLVDRCSEIKEYVLTAESLWNAFN